MMNTTPTDSGAPIGRLELRLHDVSQLFESLDPSPFRDKDLDRNAEEYIVESARELRSESPFGLVIYLNKPAGHPDEEGAVGDAIRAHFARRALFLQRKLQQVLRRGSISLAIGVAFLTLLFVAVQLTGLVNAESGPGTLVRESMLIVGWVAMWRPLEVFLYDWWPIVGERRLHDRLSRVEVRIVRGARTTHVDSSGDDPKQPNR
jgi:hypothetical protein